MIISLVESVSQLQEVVVSVGYGTQKSKNVTNAISLLNQMLLKIVQF